MKTSIENTIHNIQSLLEDDNKYSYEVKNISILNGEDIQNDNQVGYYSRISFDIPNSTHKKLEITYTIQENDLVILDIKSIFESINSNSINDVYNKELRSTMEVYNSILDINKILEDALKNEVSKISPVDIMILHNMSYLVGYTYQGITDNILQTIESVADQYQSDSKDKILDQINMMDNELMKKIFSTEHIVLSMGKKNLIFYAPRKTLVNIIFNLPPNEDNVDCKVDVLSLHDPLINEDIMKDPITVLLKNSVNNS